VIILLSDQIHVIIPLFDQPVIIPLSDQTSVIIPLFDQTPVTWQPGQIYQLLSSPSSGTH
jgi:hypothetical protein